MNLEASLFEFSGLLEIATRTLQSLIEDENATTGRAAVYVDEVAKIAERLREISEQLATKVE